MGTISRPEAFAINDSGRSIGKNGYGTSTEWTKTGATTALGSLRGGTGGNELWAINDHDTAVGADLTKHGKVATLWSATGKAKNLQEFLGAGWSDTQANAINDAGDICGVGDHNNVQSAFELLWVPAAGSADNGSYINAASQSVLAASAVHAPVTESAAHGFASVGHGPG